MLRALFLQMLALFFGERRLVQMQSREHLLLVSFVKEEDHEGLMLARYLVWVCVAGFW